MSASSMIAPFCCWGTGRTGGRVLQQLLARGVRVRAVVRSAERLPAGVR